MSHFLAQTGYESGGFNTPKGESGCYTIKNDEGWRIWFTKTWAETPLQSNCAKGLLPQIKGNKKIPWKQISDVPNDYICGKNIFKGEELNKKFFSYVYQCEGGNGDVDTHDGYKFRGHGAIQLTWKKAYENFANWLKDKKIDNYDKILTTPEIIDTNTELFILSAMWFWNDNDLNDLADKDKTDNITYKINSRGLERLKRSELSIKIKELLK